MDNGGNDPRKMTDEEFEAELLRQLGDSLAHERDEQVRKGPLEIAPTLLLSAYLTFCMLVFAFGANAAVSGAFLLVSAVLVSATVRSPIQILLLALPVFLLVSGTGSLSFGAYLAALWLGAGYAAFLFRTARPFMVLPFVAAVPVAAERLLCRHRNRLLSQRRHRLLPRFQRQLLWSILIIRMQVINRLHPICRLI